MEVRQNFARSFRWAAAAWTAFGVFDAVQTVFSMRAEGMHHAWTALFFTNLFSWLPWALATPFVLWLSRRFPASSFKRPQGWLAHIGACAVIDVVYATWTTTIFWLFNPYLEPVVSPFTTSLRLRLLNTLVAALVLYVIVLVVGFVVDSHERLVAQQTETARLNEQLSRAQLDALRRQIEPHFLFNTLNSISALVRETRNDDAIRMIAGLSDLLRRSLDGEALQHVPLREEVEFVQKYLAIQQMRFADRLLVQMEVPVELAHAQVPCLILQPMVENAVKHGIAHRTQGGIIRIAASQSSGLLTLRVCNDGPALAPDWQSTCRGIGIANVRTRLESLYGDASALDLRNQVSGGVEATLTLPLLFRTAEA